MRYFEINEFEEGLLQGLRVLENKKDFARMLSVVKKTTERTNIVYMEILALFVPDNGNYKVYRDLTADQVKNAVLPPKRINFTNQPNRLVNKALAVLLEKDYLIEMPAIGVGKKTYRFSYEFNRMVEEAAKKKHVPTHVEENPVQIKQESILNAPASRPFDAALKPVAYDSYKKSALDASNRTPTHIDILMGMFVVDKGARTGWSIPALITEHRNRCDKINHYEWIGVRDFSINSLLEEMVNEGVLEVYGPSEDTSLLMIRVTEDFRDFVRDYYVLRVGNYIYPSKVYGYMKKDFFSEHIVFNAVRPELKEAINFGNISGLSYKEGVAAMQVMFLRSPERLSADEIWAYVSENPSASILTLEKELEEFVLNEWVVLDKQKYSISEKFKAYLLTPEEPKPVPPALPFVSVKDAVANATEGDPNAEFLSLSFKIKGVDVPAKNIIDFMRHAQQLIVLPSNSTVVIGSVKINKSEAARLYQTLLGINLV